MIEWYMLVPSIVYSHVLNEFSAELKTKYGMTHQNFSSISNSVKDAVFPYVYVETLPSSEKGMDLEGTNINAGMFSFQIEVYDNRSQSRAREIMSEVMRIMKTMRFEVSEMPTFNKEDTYRCVARFRRIVGAGDII